MLIPLTPTCPQCGASLPYVNAAHQGCSFVAMPVGSLERAVYRMYAEYPTLFGRTAWARWKIFDQMFCVIGNGLEWRGGVLVDTCDRPTPIHRVVMKTPADEVADINARWGWGYNTEDEQRIAREWAAVGQPKTFYSLCGYSAICNIPDNVRPDWLQACRDTLAMIDMVPATYHEPRGNAQQAALIDNGLARRFRKAAA